MLTHWNHGNTELRNYGRGEASPELRTYGFMEIWAMTCDVGWLMFDVMVSELVFLFRDVLSFCRKREEKSIKNCGKRENLK